MHDISKMIEENRVEAINLVKAKGCKIYFVPNIIINNPDDEDEDDWSGNINDFDVPWVVVPYGNDLKDVAVLGVNVTEGNGIEFLLYDGEYVLGWDSYTSVVPNTDACVYDYIVEFNNNKD